MYIIAIAGFCLAYYTVNVVQLHWALKRAFKIDPQKRLKPIDCTQCLTVWLTFTLYFLPIELSQAIAVIFGAGFIAAKVR